jgi:sialic acid synthase SpsE
VIQFAERAVGPGHPCLVIAELGTSHQGDLLRAEDLIGAAVQAGAECVKFQLVHAEEILHPLSGLVDLPTGRVALYETFKALERDTEFYAALKSRTEAAGALFLCSPFGIGSARELKSMGVSALKIASPELNHFPLLEEVATYALPLFISSGVSLLADIERCLSIVGRRNVALLHCITSYPAPEEEYNVSVLRSLGAVLGIPMGLSDHSLDPVLVPALAALCGACVVEKHFTLSRSGIGLDDPIAITPKDFTAMVQAIRDVESADPYAARAGLERAYGRERVAAVLGNGVKELADSERPNYPRTVRSLHALRAISAGEAIRAEDIGVLRTEKVLRPGLGPQYLPLVTGATARRQIPDGEGVEWADII